MQTRFFHDLRLSRLTLGTVQLGLSYGIANTVGKPDLAAVRAILGAAHECGINCLDTAAIYGDSEAVIGQALGELGLSDEFTIVTKLPHMAAVFSSNGAVDAFVESAVLQSLQRLKLDVLPFCLFHTDRNYRYLHSLLKLRDRGLVRYIGCSLNDVQSVALMLEDGQAQAIQFPVSVLDTRYICEGMLLAAPETALFARSIYLQGLLLMPEERVPRELQAVLRVRRALQIVAREAGMSPEELCMRYVLSFDSITSLVIGAETASQVRHNAVLMQGGPLDRETFNAATLAVPDLPDAILSPSQWPQRMPNAVPAKG